MTFAQAMKECQRLGTAHATGDALRAMYARLVAQLHGGDAQRYFVHLRGTTSDRETERSARALLSDRAAAWDVLLGEGC